jgi:serine/threonine-protein kinase RsbW
VLSGRLAEQVEMKQPDTVELDLPARLESLAVIEACIRTLLSQEPDLSDRDARTFEVVLAVHETFTNIIEHAYQAAPGRVQLALTFLDQPRRLEITLHDTGETFDLSEVQPPNLDEPQTGGYGLYLIHHLMDEVVYSPERGNNRWRLVKHI